jgi:nitrate reductase gamma subunit
MSDDLLFAQLPYLALAIAAVALLVQSTRAFAAAAASPASTRPLIVRSVTAICAGVVLVHHGLLIAAPHVIGQWNVGSRRLLTVELVGVAVGLVASLSALDVMRRALTAAAPQRATLAGTLHATLAAVAMASGVAVAIVYRWAAAWSVVTLTPYVVSLGAFQPRVSLVASAPFLVRLHLLGAFACVAALPLGRAASAAIASAARGVRSRLASLAAMAHGARAHAASIAALRSRTALSEEER